MEGLDDKSIGLDCSIVPSKRYEDIFVVSTTDFFYPLVESPYLQGKIAAANVLSDMYALGLYDIDNVLMILAACREMPYEQRKTCTKEMMKGFNDLCAAAGTRVTGGQTVLNPWPIIGGVAKSVAKEPDMVRPDNAVPGDVIVLTKPIGTQVAVNAFEWVNDEHKWSRVQDDLEGKIHLTKDDVTRAFRVARASMIRLNRTGARLMHKYKAHGATDVTGFGILGHANNLALAQKQKVHFRLHTLPIIKQMHAVADVYKFFNLTKGYSAETSGGLLVVLPKEHAQNFIDEIQKLDGWPAWIVGDVLSSVEDKSRASIAEDFTVVEV